MGLKRNLLLVFVVLVVLGGISSLFSPTEKDDNVQDETTKTGSETARTEGILSVQDVWWTKNGNAVTEVEQGDTVKGNIRLIANNGVFDGDITINIKKDIPLLTDTNHISEDLNVKITKNSQKVISLSFTASEASSSSFRGYFVEVEGEVSWTMDSSFPPRLTVNSKSEPEPEIDVSKLVSRWVFYDKWLLSSERIAGTTPDLVIPEGAIAIKGKVSWEGTVPVQKGYGMLDIELQKLVDAGEHNKIVEVETYHVSSETKYILDSPGFAELMSKIDEDALYYYVEVIKANIGDCIIEVYFGYE